MGLFGVPEFDEDGAARHRLPVGEVHAVDQLGGRRGQRHRLAALGDPQDLDLVRERTRRNDRERDLGRTAPRAAPAASAGTGTALRRRLSAAGSGMPGADQFQAAGDHHHDQDHKGAEEEKMPS